jgi:SAM-dependent methyltransferase
MAEYDALYHQQAMYYEIALERDVSGAIDFLQAAYERFTRCEAQSMLDVCCGPAYHGRAAAARGLRAVGLDFQPEMIARARERAEADGLTLEFVEADMRGFGLETPVDVALGAFDAVDGLLTNEDMIAHLCSVAASLTASGLYIIELIHPLDCMPHHYGLHIYSGKRDGIEVDVVWGTNHPLADLVTSVVYVEAEIRVNDHGQHYLFHDAAYERLYTPQEIALLAKLSGVFDVAGFYGDYNLNQPLDQSDASRRMIAVLQKRV